MSALLDESVDFQLLIWGYAITGDACEHSALVAESRRPSLDGWWDATSNQLASQGISDGRLWRRVPDWWALKHLPMAWRERAMRTPDDAARQGSETTEGGRSDG